MQREATAASSRVARHRRARPSAQARQERERASAFRALGPQPVPWGPAVPGIPGAPQFPVGPPPSSAIIGGDYDRIPGGLPVVSILCFGLRTGQLLLVCARLAGTRGEHDMGVHDMHLRAIMLMRACQAAACISNRWLPRGPRSQAPQPYPAPFPGPVFPGGGPHGPGTAIPPGLDGLAMPGEQWAGRCCSALLSSPNTRLRRRDALPSPSRSQGASVRRGGSRTWGATRVGRPGCTRTSLPGCEGGGAATRCESSVSAGPGLAEWVVLVGSGRVDSGRAASCRLHLRCIAHVLRLADLDAGLSGKGSKQRAA